MTKIAEVLQHNDGLGADNLLQLLKKLVPQLPATLWYLTCWSSVSVTLLTDKLRLWMSSSPRCGMLWSHKLLGSSTTGLRNCNLCECNLHHEKEQFHQKFSWRQDDVSLSGKEILWLWNGETWLISIYKASQSSNEEEFCLNVNMVATWDPRSLMWRICSGRSLTLKLQLYHLSLTHCTVIVFYCITYHGDWHSHSTVWSKPWLFFHPPSTPLSSFQTSLCVCDNVFNSTL